VSSVGQIAWRFGAIQASLALTAMLLFMGALLLFWASVRAFGADKPKIAFTSSLPERLVLTGPYSRVRHPIYSAYILYWLGSFAATPTVLSLVALIAMGYLYNRAAREEEAAIETSSLAGAYREHKARAGMFLPRLNARR
jgi:protein-S-isoprenylcysteine O-methyltransferase Ste14